MKNVIYLYEWLEKFKFLKEKYYFEIVSKCLKYLRKFYMLYENIWTILEMYIGIFPIFCDKWYFWNNLISNVLGWKWF